MSAPQPGRRSGRPRSLTRERVARAALAEGVGRMSMPTVARRLGVSHSTLYRYVHDRDDLVLAAVDLAVREFDWPAPTPDWRATLTALADAVWDLLARHPGLAGAAAVVPGMPRAAAEQVGRYVATLRAAGFSAEDALLGVDFVIDLTLGTAGLMTDLARRHATPDGPRPLHELHRRTWPELVELVGGPAADQLLTGRGWFDRKLVVLLDGLAARLP
ncbi:TetR/AcrR family transcriptional regulator [Pseudonocardia lacus]|uniref:TetR/AcrR family transcriptional regulator n=1 Tax=Pseudonocardia lacus TaxID=2835865 RepID=UPI001BDC2840|nr:TetR/AcrR family transcriptional regulator C-terminal domain-containing protein [Pseudonocardia lacus]